MAWLERRFGLVVLALSGLAAYFGADGAARLALSAILPGPEGAVDPTPLARASAAPPFHSQCADALLAHNPFDSASRSLSGAEPAAAPACDRVRVVAVAVSSDTDWSMAALAVDGMPASVLRRRGGEVAGLRVEYVGADRVYLNDGDRHCEAALFAPRPPPSPGTDQARIPARPSLAGIARLGATEFAIDRSLVDRVLSDQAELMKFGQVAPDRDREGRVLGIRLVNVQRDTLPGLLGLESGDRLEAINGYSLTDPERMLEAYAHLREASRLRLQLQRAGRTLNLDYAVR